MGILASVALQNRRNEIQKHWFLHPLHTKTQKGKCNVVTAETQGHVLAQYATRRKVASSIPDIVTRPFFPFRPHYGAGVDTASNRNEY